MSPLAEMMLNKAAELLKVAGQQDNSANGRKRSNDCEELAKKCLKQCAELMSFEKGGAR